MEKRMKRLRIGLYSPYLSHHLGGGERYILTVASCAQNDHDVTIFFDENTKDLEIHKKRHEHIFDLDLSKTRYEHGPFGRRGNWFYRYFLTRKFDVFYYLTDGSFFFSGAQFNIAHIQIPLSNPFTTFSQKLKFLPWKVRVANSQFTKNAVERTWRIPVQYVHYGRCDSNVFHPGKKEDIILSVGRFFVGGHNKKHDILIESFKKLNVRGWRLILIGHVDPGRENRGYVERLRTMAKGYPIEIETDTSFQELVDTYGRANIYWHAAGFGEDEVKHPERVEHMGLTTVEAMASGCVPVVICKGGQKELINDNDDGFLWDSIDDLLEKTQLLMRDAARMKMMQEKARKKSLQFSAEGFCAQFQKILEDIVQ